jgi:putative transposase
MYRPFKYRIYPFRSQQRELLHQLGELTFLWNYALKQRQTAWRTEHRTLSYVDQCRSLAKWRAHDKEGIGRVYGHVAQETLARLDDAYLNFFRRVKAHKKPGHPHFRSELTSLTYPDSNGSAAIVPGCHETRRLHLAKIGEIPIEVHRKPVEGKVKTCTVKREGDRWYAILTIETPDPSPPPTSFPEKPVGVDLGLRVLATLSTGEKVAPPRFMRKAETHLKRQQRKLSRKVKGSANWHQQKLRVTRAHAKVRDQRRDFAHKLTTGWADTYDLIAFEDVDLRGLVRTRMSKSILDAGWEELRAMSAYKQANRSHHYVEVQTKDTTQSCSTCGENADPPLTLKDRVFRCPRGHVEDRDANAARNVLNRALAIVGRGTPESTPVEIGPPPPRKGRRVRSVMQEPPYALGVAT